MSKLETRALSVPLCGFLALTSCLIGGTYAATADRSLEDASKEKKASYEGFGAVTKGARSSPDGFKTFHVTSLADRGRGTLRDGLSKGKRLIVFDVGGTITLESDLNVRYSYVTIDGSSAPAPGITIEQPGDIGTTIEARASTGAAHDIIIHHLRMDGKAGDKHTNKGDIWGLDGDNAPVYKVVIDHVTATSATDGIFDIYGEVRDVTISWNLMRKTVTTMHMSTGQQSQKRERISFHHNVLAQNNERQIRLRHNNQLIDFVNNVIYGWGFFEGGAAGLHIAYDAGEVNPHINVIGNVFHFVDGLKGAANDAIKFERGKDGGQVHFADNIVPAKETDGKSTSKSPLPIPKAARVTIYPAKDLWKSVVPKVGTHHPTADETRLLTKIAGAVK